MWNKLYSETEIVKLTIEALEARFPTNWSFSISALQKQEPFPAIVMDAILEIRDPSGVSTSVSIEVKKKPPEAQQVVSIADRWRRILADPDQSSINLKNYSNLMVVAPFIGLSARGRLAEEGISYADLTGNIRLVLNSPAVFVESYGANKNPYRENVPLQSLRGRAAGRVVRGFLDYQPPFGIRELATITKSSIASIFRVADLLQREAIIRREAPRGRIFNVDWERLLRRWVTDYDFMKINNMETWLEPRGTRAFLNKLKNTDYRYAITGSFAAKEFAPVAEPRLLALYVESPNDFATSFGLRITETGGNIIMGRPFDPVVFDRTTSIKGMTYSRVTQVAADLLTGPGRNPIEAESLIEWMRLNESIWQIPLTNIM
jgi:hypothetical protein